MSDEIEYDDAKGRVKEAAGDLTGDKDLKREGKVDQARQGQGGRREGHRQDQGRPQAGLAEEVLGARAAQGAAPGPSSSLTCGRGRGRSRRDAAGLVADQVGRRRGLVGDRDQGRLQLAAAGVVAPAPVVERGRPAQPIATSAWPRRQARPKLSATITPTRAPAGGARFRRGCGGRRRRGPRAAGRPCRARAGWRCRCRRWRRRSRGWVSTIRTPRSARSTSRLSSRISSTRAGSLPSTAASLRASAPGIDRGELADPALRLGDDLLRDRRRRRRRSSSARPAISSPSAHPLANSGSPATGRTRELAGRSYPQRLGGAPGAARGAPPARGSGRRRRPGCRGRGRARRAPRPRRGRRPRGRRRRGGRGCPRRRRGRSRRAGARTRALVPLAVAVGDDRRRSARGRRSAAGRARAGRAAGSRRAGGRRSRRPRLRRGRSRPGRPRRGPRRRGRGRPRRRPRRRAPARPGRR